MASDIRRDPDRCIDGATPLRWVAGGRGVLGWPQDVRRRRRRRVARAARRRPQLDIPRGARREGGQEPHPPRLPARRSAGRGGPRDRLWVHATSTSGNAATRAGSCWPIRRATNSASSPRDDLTPRAGRVSARDTLRDCILRRSRLLCVRSLASPAQPSRRPSRAATRRPTPADDTLTSVRQPPTPPAGGCPTARRSHRSTSPTRLSAGWIRRCSRDPGRRPRRPQPQGIDIQITSGWRSRGFQQRLFDDARRHLRQRRGGGTVRRVARRVQTRRGQGRGHRPRRGRQVAHRQRSQFGLCQIYANELWHFELGGRQPGPLPAAETQRRGLTVRRCEGNALRDSSNDR